MTTEFQNPIARNVFVYPPYNPFITARNETDKEVHLTNRVPSYADATLFGTGKGESNPGLGLYYITYDENGNQKPFAIDIAFDEAADMKTYAIPTDREAINLYYSDFMKWVKSGRKNNKDWYLHPVR